MFHIKDLSIDELFDPFYTQKLSRKSFYPPLNIYPRAQPKAMHKQT